MTPTARTLKLRFLWPPKEVFPNARPNRYAKARAVKQYRYICQMDARQQGWTGPRTPGEHLLASPVKATVTFVVPDHRKRDTANMMDALKALWDGIVDAGLLVDDSHEHLRHGEPSVRVEKGQRYVLVTLEEQR